MPSLIRTVNRWIVAVVFIAAGVAHFVIPDVYMKLVPPIFPAARVMVFVSGIAEIAGGAGLLVPRLRRWAGIGLIGLLIAVWPVHWYMAFAPDLVPRGGLPAWLVWARLPFQIVLIAWVWWAARPDKRSARLRSDA